MTHGLKIMRETSHLMFVLVFTEGSMVRPVSDNLASCEISAVMCFLHTKNMSAA
jgi:hypothetical protein